MNGPFDSPVVRYTVGIGGAAAMVAIALLSLDGPIRYAVHPVAVVDAVVTPQVLKRAT